MPDESTFRWQPLPNAPSVYKRMKVFYEAWKGTSYMPGNRVRGAGVDCAQLVPAFLDHMFLNGRNTVLPRLAPDTSAHDRVAAWGTVRTLRKSYPSEVVRDGVIEPGDVIITRATESPDSPMNPGHAMIAWTIPGTAIHAMPQTGVTRTSIEVTRGIVRVYRIKEKHRWAL